MKKLITLCLAFLSFPALALDVAGHWWQPTEPGWGMAIQQQRDTAFIQLYTYDADGLPVWYVASCPLTSAVCSATLYETAGGSPLPYYTKPTSAPAGVITLTFLSDRAAVFSFKIGDGPAWTKDIEKMTF